MAMTYPSRLEGESDKTYLKRILNSLPDPAELPEKHNDYFECANATVLPTSLLRSSKSVAENKASSANAAKAMAAAQAGVIGKRVPLRVTPAGDGTFRIIDGNATFTAAVHFGWRRIPVLIDEVPSIAT